MRAVWTSKRLRPATLAALAHRDYQLLWSGFVISNLGSQLQVFALGWYVVQLATADGTPKLAPLYLGLVAATRAIPLLIIGMLAGTVSDRMDRRRLLLFSATGSGLVAAAFAVSVITGIATLPLVLVLNTLAAATFSFEPVTRMAMVPRLVPRAAIASAVGLMMTTQTMGAFFGPLIGGVLIGPIGVAGLMALNALSYLAVVLAMVLIRPMALEAPARGAFLRNLAGGFVHVWKDPFLRVLFFYTALVGLGGRAYQQLLPAFATDVLGLGAVELSWLFAAAGAGAMGGALVVATAGNSSSRGRIFALTTIATGALTVLFSAQRSLPAALVGIAALSLASSAQIGLHVAAYQEAAPDHVRGRVTAVSASTVQSCTALGALAIGAIGSLARLDLALAFGGVVVLLAGIGALRATAFRAWERGELAGVLVQP